MKVRVIQRPTGLLNGVEWPEEGETIDLPDAVAKGMIEAGTVGKLSEKKKADKVEKRPAPTEGVETRKAPAKKAAAKRPAKKA